MNAVAKETALAKVVFPLNTGNFQWGTISWLAVVHGLSILAVVYMHTGSSWGSVPVLTESGFKTATAVLAGALFLLCHLSIRTGAHALYAHATYKAATWLQYVKAALFSATFQGTELWWAAIHRMHHRFTDTPLDPHNIKQGFWYAHWRWLGRKKWSGLWFVRQKLISIDDLQRNRPLRWQARNHLRLAIGVGLILPTAVAAMWGDALGGFLVGGFLRLVVQYHSTWTINSVSHRFGSNPFPSKGSARNAPWWSIWLHSPITVGEGGGHADHHRFSGSYALGCSWYHALFDIGRWEIRFWAILGQAWDLRLVPRESYVRALLKEGKSA